MTKVADAFLGEAAAMKLAKHREMVAIGDGPGAYVFLQCNRSAIERAQRDEDVAAAKVEASAERLRLAELATAGHPELAAWEALRATDPAAACLHHQIHRIAIQRSRVAIDASERSDDDA